MPKISVIIPVYNTENYLGKCLDSVCNQTLSDIEIICINDCSTDNSSAILEKYAENDSRIIVINSDKNNGSSISRNIGIKKAKGEYLGFIDSDDFIAADFLKKLYDKASEDYCDVVKGNIYNYNPIYKEYKLTEFYNMNDKIKNNYYYFYYGFTSAIYKSSFIKKNNICFPEKICFFEDPYFSIKTVLNLKTIEIENDAKYFYVKNSSSLTSNYNNIQNAESMVNSINLILQEMNKYNLSIEKYSILFNFLLEQIMSWCTNFKLSNQENITAVSGLLDMFEKTDFPKKELLISYLLYKKYKTKKQNRNQILSHIRKTLSIAKNQNSIIL